MKFIVAIIGIYGAAITNAYFAGPVIQTWAEAEAYCVSQGSHLASMHSQNDFNAVVALCEATGDETGCHIGAEMDGNPGTWKWSDGSATDFGFIDGNGGQLDTNIWNTGDATSNQHCSYIWDAGTEWQFEDIDCDGRYDIWGLNPAICNGDDTCDESMLGERCLTDRGCPDCMQCCPRKKECEYPPQYAKALLSNVLHRDEPKQFPEIEVNTKNIGKDPDFAAPAPKNTNNYFGYIMLIGVIAFILINNLFIGYWCVTRKSSGGYKFEKVVVE